jgi:hypothetical protein
MKCGAWERVFNLDLDRRSRTWAGEWQRDCGDVGANIRRLPNREYGWAVYEGSAESMPLASGQERSTSRAKQAANEILRRATQPVR